MAVSVSGAQNNLFLFLIFGISTVVIIEALKCDEQGKFGWRCRFTCRCSDGQDCDKETGYCVNGCAEGYYGTGCQFKNEFIYGGSKGKRYMGRIDQTGNNKKCLSWDDARVISERKTFHKNNFPDQEVPGPYCRNPLDPEHKAYSDYPWCYTLDNVTNLVEFNSCTQLKVTECPDFLFGDECDYECHCSNVSEVCDKGTGYCQQNCHAGWMGIDCSRPCMYNKYGIDCKKSCGHCQFDSCDHETGKCLKGCKSGFHNVYCTQKCGKGVYGVNCRERCGQCRDGDCHPETGECFGGCLPGYTGDLCKDRCPNGKYGLECFERCPYCFNRGPCHPETGVCEKGCAPGYMGKSCDMECRDGFFGANCTMECGYCISGQPCDKYTGQCIEGCAKGYTGSACIIGEVEVKESSIVGAVVGGIIAVVVIIVLAVILLMVYRKRRFSTKMIVTSDVSMTLQKKEHVIDDVQETSMLLRSTSATDIDHHVEDEDCAVNIYDKTTQEPIYVNVNTKNLCNPIKVEELQSFINKAKDNDYAIMRAEHGDLPTGLLALCHTALKPENKSKNRYADIIAYDHSRVVLSPLPHDPHSDYVNANAIDGYSSKKAYIASQGPNKAMLADFWRMIWQEKVTKIVMLTNLVETYKKKCEQYWPSEGSITYGEVTVEMIDTAEYTDYIVRTFTISASKSTRIIKQFHFTSWTDHGAPTYPTTLLNFRRKVQQYNPDSNAPILVHCSAGIGRSGTYIAVDYLLQQAKAEGVIDLVQCAQLMRSNRVNMIQTWQQYSFVYDAVLDALLSGETTIPNSTFSETYEEMCTLKPETSSTLLEDQFDTLEKLSPMIERDECKAATDPNNIQKSRFKNILPADRFRPKLLTPVEGCNDFINAVFLPSYTQRDAYIVTQMPLPSTVADFWRLLYDYHSDTVVMLNEFDRNDKSCALYWPEEYGYTVEYGPLSIELLFSSEADTNITVRTFKLTNTIKGEDRAVKQFQFNGWPDYKSVPMGTSGLLRLSDAVQEWTRQNGKGPVTIHCMNGASKSGLFCACSLLFERMRIDLEVDVYQTVKQIRINRPHFVENMEQYQYCYQMALAYLERQPMGIDRQTDRQNNDSIDSGIQDKLS